MIHQIKSLIRPINSFDTWTNRFDLQNQEVSSGEQRDWYRERAVSRQLELRGADLIVAEHLPWCRAESSTAAAFRLKPLPGRQLPRGDSLLPKYQYFDAGHTSSVAQTPDTCGCLAV